MNISRPDQSPLVAVIMGSDSDFEVMKEACKVLASFEVPFELRVLSAHRSPRQTSDYAAGAKARGIKVLIAGAGWAAHLAGAIAAQTPLPVIGVPIDSSPLKGMDALLATVQMPPGVPVATMAVGKGGARNAALFAVQILALEQPDLMGKLRLHKEKMVTQVLEKDKKLKYCQEV